MKLGKKEEQKEIYQDAFRDQRLYLNYPIQLDECVETLEYFASNTTTVSVNGVSYQMLNHVPLRWKQYQQCWLNETLPTIWKQSVIIPILKQRQTTIRSWQLQTNCGHIASW